MTDDIGWPPKGTPSRAHVELADNLDAEGIGLAVGRAEKDGRAHRHFRAMIGLLEEAVREEAPAGDPLTYVPMVVRNTVRRWADDYESCGHVVHASARDQSVAKIEQHLAASLGDQDAARALLSKALGLDRNVIRKIVSKVAKADAKADAKTRAYRYRQEQSYDVFRAWIGEFLGQRCTCDQESASLSKKDA